MINKGGNYGWRCYEGNHTYNPTGCAAASAYTAPIHEYNHSTGYAISGGYVYNGSIQSLAGSYIFTDFGSGPIWVMRDPFGSPIVSELINNTTTNNMYKSSFAEDASGEIYVLSYGDGFIYRIDASGSTPNSHFPDLLSETGRVDLTDTTQMGDGLIPYEINAPFWSDGAAKDRWLAIPDNTTITVQANGDWSFPNNSVLVKNFRINNKLVETRLLVKHNNGGWAGYSYEWDDNETDATYIANGKTKMIAGQNYIYPSSIQCMRCHTATAGTVLGPETRQLNRNTTLTGVLVGAEVLGEAGRRGVTRVPRPGGVQPREQHVAQRRR